MNDNQSWRAYPGNEHIRRRWVAQYHSSSFEQKNSDDGNSHVTSTHTHSVSSQITGYESDDKYNKMNGKKKYSNKHSNNEKQKETQLNNEDFQCPICFELLCEPVTLTCGHCYCYHCILRWILDQPNAKYVFLYMYQ